MPNLSSDRQTIHDLGIKLPEKPFIYFCSSMYVDVKNKFLVNVSEYDFGRSKLYQILSLDLGNICEISHIESKIFQSNL